MKIFLWALSMAFLSLSFTACGDSPEKFVNDVVNSGIKCETHGLLRRFAPLCGAASLAVFLGLGENADILGHLYGFIAGLLCGFIPTKKALRWGTPSAATDILGVLAYCALFAVGWTLAI